MKHNHITTVQEDGVVQLPKEFIDQLRWDENTNLMFLMDGDNIILKEKIDWTIEDFQNNLEIILERINTTGKPHYLLYEGKTFAIVPYSNEIMNILNITY
jgi:bifunctional DNA-binding transcriptional regulator/antitoxin component of YhaV-PrlF toxin-antitoxin module